MSDSVNDTTGIVLLKRIAAKDRKAFEEFYYLYAEGFGRFLMKMLKRQDWVDEAVNDVMLTVWQIAERYDPQLGKLTTWLFGIAHNKGIKTLARYGRYRESSLEDLPMEIEDDTGQTAQAYALVNAVAAEPEKTVMGWELGDALSWAFDKLSPDHQAVIELCFSQDFTYQEIAEIMDCPINTVKTRLFHARKKLSVLLAEKGFTLSSYESISL